MRIRGRVNFLKAGRDFKLIFVAFEDTNIQVLATNIEELQDAKEMMDEMNEILGIKEEEESNEV